MEINQPLLLFSDTEKHKHTHTPGSITGAILLRKNLVIACLSHALLVGL